MLSNARIIAFVATTDADRSKAFYGETLGLRLIDDDRFAIVFDANGTMLRVQKVEKAQPPPFTVLGWQVSDIRFSVNALAGRGVSFERYQWFQQDDLGIWTAPSGAKVAWFKDPDGNVLSLSQFP